MENVSAGGDFPDFIAIFKRFHAYDTLLRIELVYFFHILKVVYNGNELAISFYQLSMCLPSIHLTILALHNGFSVPKLVSLQISQHI